MVPEPAPAGWSERRLGRLLRGGRGRPVGALAILLVAGVAVGPESAVHRALLGAAVDTYQTALPRQRLSAPVVVVEIDETSLLRHGQWPWPRTLLARLISAIGLGQPAAIGLDLVMPEPDRLSPDRLARLLEGIAPELALRLARLPGSDERLARAMAGQPVVLGVIGVGDPPAGAGRPPVRSPIRVDGTDPRPAVLRFPALLGSLDVIDAAATGRGLLNAEPDRGVVRRLPLVAAVGPELVPGLGVEMLRVAASEAEIVVRAGPRGVETVRIGDLALPAGRDGTAWLHYGPSDASRFVSAGDVLEGRVDPRRFERKLVLIGATAVAMSDHHATPVGERMAGVEIHAQLLEAIFEDSVLRRPTWSPWAEAGALLAGGLLLLLAVPALRPALSGLLLAAELVVLIGLGLLLYQRMQLILSPAWPVIGLGLTFTAMLGASLTEADSNRRVLRRQLQAQREAAARVAGELDAARRIQMGTLPSAVTAFPGERRFGLHAALEPARAVSGDLYDFFMLDRDRLFFLIGDVSGKGLPASLFMAVSKALCKSAALRRHRDLAAMLREAEGELQRDNPELYFVTVFAGILDCETGRMEYVAAGHDAPYLLGAPSAPLGRLRGGEGPPLCAGDGFPYTAASCTLAPGDIVCLVTDGVTEAGDATGALYGRERLEARLRAGAGSATAAEAARAVLDDLARFVGAAEPADDLTMLVLRWTGP